MRTKNKSERIRDLDDGIRTNTQIAAIVGCPVTYVRTALQRTGGRSEYDIRYHEKKKRNAPVTAPTKDERETVA